MWYSFDDPMAARMMEGVLKDAYERPMPDVRFFPKPFEARFSEGNLYVYVPKDCLYDVGSGAYVADTMWRNPSAINAARTVLPDLPGESWVRVAFNGAGKTWLVLKREPQDSNDADSPTVVTEVRLQSSETEGQDCILLFEIVLCTDGCYYIRQYVSGSLVVGGGGGGACQCELQAADTTAKDQDDNDLVVRCESARFVSASDSNVKIKILPPVNSGDPKRIEIGVYYI